MRNQKKQPDSDVSKIDYGIILSVMLLALISLITIYSTTYMMSTTPSLRPTIMQVLWYIIGAVAVIVLMQFDSEQLWKLAPIAYGLGVLLLILVLIFYDRRRLCSARCEKLVRIRTDFVSTIRSGKNISHYDVRKSHYKA